jgi:hypothetical protein
MNNNIIHLQGFLEISQDGIEFKGKYNSIAEQIAHEISQLKINYENSKHMLEDDYAASCSLYLPRVSLQAYFSEDQISLEEVKEKIILNTMGCLDIYTEWYGYSEWTILGYSVENFTIGNHNLEEILSSYSGKYAHIVLEILKEDI